MQTLLFFFYAAIAIWIVYVFFCHKSSRDGWYYKIRRTPLFYFFGSPYKIVRSEIDATHTYISVRIDRGIVIHFLIDLDMDCNWIGCNIEKWLDMHKLKVTYFATPEGQFRSPDDISNNFEIDKIKNYQDFKMTNQDFEKIKKAFLIAAKHVEKQKNKKKTIKIF